MSSPFDYTLPHVVIHLHRQSCQRCGRLSLWTACYMAVTKRRNPSDEASGPTRRELTPISTIPAGIRVVTQQLSGETTAACWHCADSFSERLSDAEALRRWQVSLDNRKASEREAAKLPPTRMTVTADDLA